MLNPSRQQTIHKFKINSKYSIHVLNKTALKFYKNYSWKAVELDYL